jgi:hypothetical protein
MNKCGVYLDKNVIFRYSKNPREKEDGEFFQYLEEHPSLAIATQDELNDALLKLIKKTKRDSEFRVYGDNFNALEKYLTKEKTDVLVFSEKLAVVENLISKVCEDFRRSINYPSSLPQKFSPIFLDPILNSDGEETKKRLRKLIIKPVEWEDKIVLAKAASLKEKYENMFLASHDYHIICPEISRAFEGELGLITGKPQIILPKIKECQTFI